MNATALWHINDRESVLKNLTLGSHKAESVKYLQSKYSLISTGTERLVAKGSVPPKLFEVMKVPYMKGSFSFPVNYGYSLIAAQDEIAYHLMHPHQDIIRAQESDLYQLKAPTPKYRAALISNMETVLNAIWDAEITDTDSIAICGFGNIGALLATTLKTHFNKSVSIIENNGWRQNKASALGWPVVTSENASFDIIFHTSATESGLQYAIDHLNVEGKVIELSWYGNQSVRLNLGLDFHYKRLKIISSQVATIPLSMQPTMTYLKRKQLAERILMSAAFDELIADFIDFRHTPAFYKDLRNGCLQPGLIWIIRY